MEQQLTVSHSNIFWISAPISLSRDVDISNGHLGCRKHARSPSTCQFRELLSDAHWTALKLGQCYQKLLVSCSTFTVSWLTSNDLLLSGGKKRRSPVNSFHLHRLLMSRVPPDRSNHCWQLLFVYDAMLHPGHDQLSLLVNRCNNPLLHPPIELCLILVYILYVCFSYT